MQERVRHMADKFLVAWRKKKSDDLKEWAKRYRARVTPNPRSLLGAALSSRATWGFIQKASVSVAMNHGKM